MREFATDPELLSLISPSGPAELSPDALIVRDVIDQLPEPLRIVFDAVFCERLSKREASRSLGLHRVEIDRRLTKVAKHVCEALDERRRPRTAEEQA